PSSLLTIRPPPAPTTSPYTTLFRSYGGGQGIINVTYKSGGNDLHGAAYEFLRNSALDAKNFFDPGNKPIPPFKLNQFGFNLGGRSEEHTSELQSRGHLVCRLLLEKK